MTTPGPRAESRGRDISGLFFENQLGRTDHDHLGKLITYAAGLGAKTVVWVASELCEEHRRALDWLNDVTQDDMNFFGLQVELWRIGDSQPAPRFNVISQPNEWVKALATGQDSHELTETKALQLAYWQMFVEWAKAKGTTFLSFPKPRGQHWYNLSIGRSGFYLSLTAMVKEKRVGCGLYIDHPRVETSVCGA